jgi:hypothetical protein
METGSGSQMPQCRRGMNDLHLGCHDRVPVYGDG